MESKIELSINNNKFKLEEKPFFKIQKFSWEELTDNLAGKISAYPLVLQKEKNILKELKDRPSHDSKARSRMELSKKIIAKLNVKMQILQKIKILSDELVDAHVKQQCQFINEVRDKPIEQIRDDLQLNNDQIKTYIREFIHNLTGFQTKCIPTAKKIPQELFIHLNKKQYTIIAIELSKLFSDFYKLKFSDAVVLKDKTSKDDTHVVGNFFSHHNEKKLSRGLSFQHKKLNHYRFIEHSVDEEKSLYKKNECFKSQPL